MPSSQTAGGAPQCDCARAPDLSRSRYVNHAVVNVAKRIGGRTVGIKIDDVLCACHNALIEIDWSTAHTKAVRSSRRNRLRCRYARLYVKSDVGWKGDSIDYGARRSLRDGDLAGRNAVNDHSIGERDEVDLALRNRVISRLADGHQSPVVGFCDAAFPQRRLDSDRRDRRHHQDQRDHDDQLNHREAAHPARIHVPLTLSIYGEFYRSRLTTSSQFWLLFQLAIFGVEPGVLRRISPQARRL